MFAIIGILVVIGGIVGGYLMEHGNLLVLYQPAELVIIGGAALGTLLIANPLSVLKNILGGLIGVLTGGKVNRKAFLGMLELLNAIFMHARKNGMEKLEQDVDAPDKSEVFSKFPDLLKNHHALAFVCDTLRMAVSGGVEPHHLDEVMEIDLEVHHKQSGVTVSALTTVAEALPGLGIVAAVLGIVITMGALGGPPEEIGHKVAAALVGTFLGILLCYGFLGPLAAAMEKANDMEAHYYNALRVGILAFVRGTPPLMSVEFARRAIPGDMRPTFAEMEESIKKK